MYCISSYGIKTGKSNDAVDYKDDNEGDSNSSNNNGNGIIKNISNINITTYNNISTTY